MLRFIDLTVNWDEVESQKRVVESRSKNSSRPVADYETVLHRLNIQTDDSFKHEYFRRDGTEAPAAYVFPDVTARLLVILRQKNIASVDREPKSLPADMVASASAEVEIENEEVGLIFDRTNFVCENGGICCDKGHVIIDGQIRFAVTRTKKQKHYVIHYVHRLDDATLVLILNPYLEKILSLLSLNAFMVDKLLSIFMHVIELVL